MNPWRREDYFAGEGVRSCPEFSFRAKESNRGEALFMEIEAKIKLRDPEKLRSVLKSTGAFFVEKVFEKNWLYDHPDLLLMKQDKLLRLREEGRVTLTFKGPRQQSEYKKREELELEFPDAPSAHSLLEAVGFRQWFYYEKIREKWRVESSEVVLDELPELGLFVEVEAPSEGEVETIRKRLKLSREYIGVSYVELLRDHAKSSRPKGTWQFRFPQGHHSRLSTPGEGR